MNRAVIFDVGGVLCSPPQLAIAEYEKQLQLPRGSLRYVFATGVPDNAFCRLERGELTLLQFIPEFEKECYLIWDQKHIRPSRGMSAFELFKLISASITPHSNMILAAQQIRHLGYQTCALTNNWIDDIGFHSQFHDINLDEHFDVVVESCKVGLRKPDLAIYKLACQQLDVHPQNAIFLDDLGVNLKAARSLGMHTIKVVSEEQGITELSNKLGFNLFTLPKHKL